MQQYLHERIVEMILTLTENNIFPKRFVKQSIPLAYTKLDKSGGIISPILARFAEINRSLVAKMVDLPSQEAMDEIEVISINPNHDKIIQNIEKHIKPKMSYRINSLKTNEQV